MKTTDIGNQSTAMCLAAFINAGYRVSVPFGDGQAYDLIIDDGKRLARVQCKTARLQSGGVIQVWQRSNNGRWYKNSGHRVYAGRADLLAAYCPETDKVYVVPADRLTQKQLSLRISPTANNQARGIHWARDFEITSFRLNVTISQADPQ